MKLAERTLPGAIWPPRGGQRSKRGVEFPASPLFFTPPTINWPEKQARNLDQHRLQQMQPDDISGSLERGSIVCFPGSPVVLPAQADPDFLREELPAPLKLKNISYHPESGKAHR